MSRRKNAVFSLILLALVLAVVEGAAALTTRVLVRRGWMANIPEFTPKQVRYYFANRNPLLGWGPAVDATGRVARLAVTRPDPAFSDTLPACASAYGSDQALMLFRAQRYTTALFRWAGTDFHVRTRLADVPRHAPFYAPDHPAGGLPLTTLVLTTFATEARADGRTPFVVLMLVGRDLLMARETGRWPDQPLADSLRAAGVAVIHAGPPMLAAMKGEDPCRLFHDCSAHYNERGYKLLADVVTERVRGAVRPEPRQGPAAAPAPRSPPPPAPRTLAR